MIVIMKELEQNQPSFHNLFVGIKICHSLFVVTNCCGFKLLNFLNSDLEITKMNEQGFPRDKCALQTITTQVALKKIILTCKEILLLQEFILHYSTHIPWLGYSVLCCQTNMTIYKRWGTLWISK